MNEPHAEKIKKVFRTHGDYRVDNYFWLRDKTNPKVKEYLEQENKHTQKWFKPVNKEKKLLLQELKNRIREDDSSVPIFFKGYWWSRERKPKKEHPIHVRSKKKNGLKQIVLDENKIAKGLAYSHVASLAISPDTEWLIYSHDNKANKKYTLFLEGISTNKKAEKLVTDVSSDVVWAQDGTHIYYVSFDDTHRPYKVWEYDLHSKQKKEIFEEMDGTLYVSIAPSTSEKFVIITVSGHSGNKQYIFETIRESVPRLIMPIKNKVDYYIDHTDSGFYLLSNAERPDSILYHHPGQIPKKISEWNICYKPKKNNHLNDFSVHKDFVAMGEVVNAEEKIKILPNKGKSYYVDTGESVGSIHIGTNKQFDTKNLRFNYQSMTTPPQVISHSLETKKNKILKTYKPSGSFNQKNYETKRIWARAQDGVKIPISLVYRKSLYKNDGTNPCLLYGYGSYGHSIFPYFSKDMFSLIDRGFVYAIAHIRGGREMGEQWYLDAKFLTKKKTFSDFISCGEYLIKKKISHPEKLCIRGGSAGGMLMGAVTNMRPDLFAGVVAQVPFVDVINTMLDESIPLTVGEFVEWGNPKNKKYYDYMKSYSPYDNIEQKDYPPIFVTAGFNDTQVHYWEAAKYVAKLRELKANNSTLLLKMDMDTGHGGKTGRYEYLKEVSDIFTFLLECIKTKK